MPKKKRAANNTGSVYRRSDGRFGYSFTGPDGRQVNRTAKTEAEAVKRLGGRPLKHAARGIRQPLRHAGERLAPHMGKRVRAQYGQSIHACHLPGHD